MPNGERTMPPCTGQENGSSEGISVKEIPSGDPSPLGISSVSTSEASRATAVSRGVGSSRLLIRIRSAVLMSCAPLLPEVGNADAIFTGLGGVDFSAGREDAVRVREALAADDVDL